LSIVRAAGQRRAKFIVCLGELAPPGVENSPMHRHQKRIKAETRGGLVFVKNPLHILGGPEITDPAEKVGAPVGHLRKQGIQDS